MNDDDTVFVDYLFSIISIVALDYFRFTPTHAYGGRIVCVVILGTYIGCCSNVTEHTTTRGDTCICFIILEL